jgi:hypothetical protein
MISLKSDPQEIRRFMEFLRVGPGRITEVRALFAKDQPNSPYSYTLGGYFSDIEAAIKAILNIGWASGIYIIPNKCDSDLLARINNRLVKLGKGDSTGDNAIIDRNYLLIDLDPARIAGISSSEQEHLLALCHAQIIAAYLRSKGWPDPLEADSGNGAHLMYRIDLPREDGGLVQRCLKSLDQIFSNDRIKVDTSVYNPARIWKCYGTPARKGDGTTERPHRMARLLKVPNEFNVVQNALLEGLASEFKEESKEEPKNPPKPDSSKKSSNQSNVPPPAPNKGGGTYDLEGFMLRNYPDAHGPVPYAGGGQIWTLKDCFFRPGDGSTMFVLKLPNGAISAGCQHDTCPGSKSTGNHWKELREHFEGSDFMRQFPGNPGLDGECSTLPRTEYGLAQRFRKRFGEHCRYVESWGGKWLVFDGQRWEQSDCAAELHAQETINAIRREAWYLKDEDDGSEEEKGQSQQGPSPVGDGMPKSSSNPESPDAGECPSQAGPHDS